MSTKPTLAEQLADINRRLTIARSVVFVAAHALNHGETDLELHSADALIPAADTLDEVLSELLVLRLDAEPSKPAQPAGDAPGADPESDEHTGNRMRAFVASMRAMRGCVFLSDIAERQERGRSLIERLALSAPGYESPRLRLTASQCANVLAYLGSVEPLDPEDWWQGPADGQSPVCGYYAVLRALEESLRPDEQDAENAE